MSHPLSGGFVLDIQQWKGTYPSLSSFPCSYSCPFTCQNSHQLNSIIISRLKCEIVPNHRQKKPLWLSLSITSWCFLYNVYLFLVFWTQMHGWYVKENYFFSLAMYVLNMTDMFFTAVAVILGQKWMCSYCKPGSDIIWTLGWMSVVWQLLETEVMNKILIRMN